MVTGEQGDHLTEVLAANGYRLTAARQAIITTLISSHGHITADELAERVREASPHVGRMTVYRTLDLLCDLGLVRPIYQGSGAAHYVLMDGGSHHHLICNRCHRIFDFDVCQESALAQALAMQLNFKVQSHLLEVHGLCEECQQADNNQQQENSAQLGA
jgi:Fur family ferric uptake transcriptional regulator